MTTRILVVDDEALIRKSLNSVLVDRGFSVELAASRQEALARFAEFTPDIVILDLRLPDGDGIDLLVEMRGQDPTVRVIMITAHGDVGKAVEAMKHGAVDFLRKPYELEEILHVVQNAAENVERDRRLNLYERQETTGFRRENIVGNCPAMQAVWETIEKVAASDSTTVLLGGESGTGKELFARGIHHLSRRRRGPMVAVNCSSFQDQLLENELFGHEKGAYTGATGLKRGLVELADGGTLFLDEVGEMPMATQAKLLRFIDDQTFRRVGGSADMRVDTRIVAATNAALDEAVERGEFRKDLYYRLKVVTVFLPPLRDRRGDIADLAHHFMRVFSARFRKRFQSISADVIDVFERYAWPGNVRELRNLLERMVLLEDAEVLEVTHLPEELLVLLPESSSDPALRPVEVTTEMTLREAADQHMLRVLEMCEGNRSRAARVLDVSRQHLIARLKAVREQQREQADSLPAEPDGNDAVRSTSSS